MSSPLDYFQYKDGRLGVDGLSLDGIAAVSGTPAYVYSARGFLDPLAELQRGLAPVGALVCFAVKACSNIHILKLLAEAGAGMDLVSGGEMARAVRAGVSPRKMVFSGVGKTADEMARALELGILSFHVESLAELELLNAVATELGKVAPVALRLNPDVDAKTHPYISTGLKRDKFGIPIRDALLLAKGAARLRNVQIEGVSIHIGSQLLSLKPLQEAFSKTIEAIQKLDRLLPAPIRLVDLGGGVGIGYRRNERGPDIPSYCRLVVKSFGPGSRLGRPIQLALEPGRLLSGNAGVLLTQVLFRKSRGAKDFLIVDAAMNDLIRPALYQGHHEIVPVEQRLDKGARKKTDVVGPVCESGDCLASARPLSPKLQSGDLMAILSAGAYGFSMSSNYNSRPRPPEFLIRNGQIEQIRRRETYADLIGPETP